MKNTRAKSMSLNNRGGDRMKSQTVQVGRKGHRAKDSITKLGRQFGVSKWGLSSERENLRCFLLRVTLCGHNI